MTVSPFNISDNSTYCSSNKNTSAEFISYAQSTRLDHNQAQKSETKKIYELPQHLAVLLTKEEIDTIVEVDTMAFDQAGCRMIQKMLEDGFSIKGFENPFCTALVDSMLDILPDVMTNQFGNYLCQKLVEVCSVSSLRKIVHATLPSLVEVSMDLHGTRVIQTLVETIGKDPA